MNEGELSSFLSISLNLDTLKMNVFYLTLLFNFRKKTFVIFFLKFRNAK